MTVTFAGDRVVSLADYGAVGDGNTDDASAFTDAATALGSAGGTIFVPTPATAYAIQTNIVLAERIKLRVQTGADIQLGLGISFDCYEIDAPYERIFTSTGNAIVRGGALVEWWGATGDGNTDDSLFVARAMLGVQGVLEFRDGLTYKLQDISIPSGVYVDLNGATASAIDDSAGYIFKFDGATDAEIKGGSVVGVGGASNGRINVAMLGSTNVRAVNITSDDGQDGFYVGAGDSADYTTQALIRACTTDGAARNGLSVISARKSHFHDLVCTGAQGSNPGAGVDIEPDSPSDYCDGLVFSAVRCSNTNETYGLIINKHAGVVNPIIATFRKCDFSSGSGSAACRAMDIRVLPTGSTLTFDGKTTITY